ncbi:MAG: class I SAM-dependent methyltransferase [Bacteroidales bacterium]|nr:class I SAM-dependent methyltransferase [Bacteroidales bacterium]
MKNNLVKKHFDSVSTDYDYYKKKNSFYYDNLKLLLKSLISENKNIFEFGCGTGDLLSSLNPKKGLGYDISGGMIKLAKTKHRFNKKLTFVSRLPTSIHPSPEYIFMSDVIEHLDNPKKEFTNIAKLMDRKTKFVMTMANPRVEPILMLAEKLKLKMPEGPHKRIVYGDIIALTKKAGLRLVRHDYKLLIPIKIPVITNLFNKYMEKYFKGLAFIEYFVFTKKDR